MKSCMYSPTGRSCVLGLIGLVWRLQGHKVWNKAVLLLLYGDESLDDQALTSP